MKKAFLLFLITLLLIILLAACGSTQTGRDIWQEVPTVPQTNKSLTVFCMDGLRDSQMIKLALEQYQDLYPDIQVELVMPGSATDYEIYQQIAAQVMSGEGPDVFIINDLIMDVQKLVREGIFADMEPFFEADSFDWEPYHKKVMDGGVWNGKRYIIPLSYDFPLLITSRTALEESGFDIDACKDYQRFLEETSHFMEDPTQIRQLFCNPLMVTSYVTEFSGISVADYDTQSIDLSSPVIQSGYQWYKTVMERNPDSTNHYSVLEGAAAVRDGHVLWLVPPAGSFNSFFEDFGAIKTTNEAVMMPIRDMNGGIQARIQYPVAVRGNSENLQNAYDYIKILLSPEIQCTIGINSLSVLNSANEFFFQEITQGKVYHIKPGTNGFIGTVNPNEALDWPTEEEFQQFIGFTQEITGTYYFNCLGLNKAMRPFIYENADYEETLKEAQQQLEIYISE